MQVTYDAQVCIHAWNEERGVGRRAVLVVDKEDMIRFRQTYAPGTLPDPEAILQVLESLE